MKTFPFEMDAASDLPLWIQLRNRLVHLINTGFYKPGEQLPTVRGLASDLAINYNTVNKAYLSMIHEGYITSARGRGVFVRELDSEQANESTRAALLLIDDCIDACLELGLTTDEIRLLMTRRLQASEQGGGLEEQDRETDKTLRVVEGSGKALNTQVQNARVQSAKAESGSAQNERAQSERAQAQGQYRQRNSGGGVS